MGVIVVVSSLAVAVGSASAALDLSSTFDSNNEGWQVSQGDGGPLSDATWLAGSGNGFIRFTDADSNELDNGGCCFAYFESPPTWAGDATNNYGGTLSFADRGNFAGDPNLTPLVILIGSSGQCLLHSFSGASGTSYSTFSTTLDTEGLQRCSDVNAPSEAEVVDLLAHFNAVQLSVDDTTTAGETADVDNVSLSGGGAPPRISVARTLTLSYSKKEKTLSGFLSAPDDTECSANQTVKIYRVHKGPDPKVAGTKTSPMGDYSLKAPSKSGKYYAKAPASKAGIADCGAAKSSKVTIG
jgi:hypothetical protein